MGNEEISFFLSNVFAISLHCNIMSIYGDNEMKMKVIILSR